MPATGTRPTSGCSRASGARLWTTSSRSRRHDERAAPTGGGLRQRSHNDAASEVRDADSEITETPPHRLDEVLADTRRPAPNEPWNMVDLEMALKIVRGWMLPEMSGLDVARQWPVACGLWP
eukprot:10389667-Alexandrium_andersonii.AAC.1